jgi:membrane-bound ClpP family serine protease
MRTGKRINSGNCFLFIYFSGPYIISMDDKNHTGGAYMNLLTFLYGINLLQILLLLTGLGLVIVEMFNPGFGIPGITGIILLIIGVALTAKNITEAIILVIIILVLIGIAFILVLHSASRGRLSKTLVLNDALSAEKGYHGTELMDEFLGKEGQAVTPLRPAGIAVIEGTKLDVVTEGEYIQANARVKVINVSGRRIVVREVK